METTPFESIHPRTPIAQLPPITPTAAAEYLAMTPQAAPEPRPVTPTMSYWGNPLAVLSRLAKAQGGFSEAGRDSTGRITSTQVFFYASHRSLVAATKGAMDAQGLALSFFPSCVGEAYRMTAILGCEEGAIISHLDYRLTLDSGGRHDALVKEAGMMQAYYIRYLHRSILGIPSGDADSDDAATQAPASTQAPVPRAAITDGTRGEIKRLQGLLGWDPAKLDAECLRLTGGRLVTLDDTRAVALIAGMMAVTP